MSLNPEQKTRREHLRRIASEGGKAKAAKLRAAKAPPPLPTGTILDLADTLGLRGPTWRAWRGFLSALFGLPLDADALATFQACTGRQAPPASVREAWLVVGRRGGKSTVAALVATYLAAYRDYRPVVRPGERPVVLCLAADKEQAAVVFEYVAGNFAATPELKRLVKKKLKHSLELHSGVVVAVATSNYRTIRGRTVAAAVLDEIAFWPSLDGANPARETVVAVRPGLATVPGSLLVALSTPFSRRGELFRVFDRDYGREDSATLVWKAPTLAMHDAPGLREHIAAMEAEDPAAARAEWHAEFRRDLEALFDLDAVRSCVVQGRRELPPLDGTGYCAFVDMSGGSQDSAALAIAHKEQSGGVLDSVRVVPAPHSPENVVAQFAAEMQRYRVRVVHGDRYAAAWCREAFEKRGVTYRASEQDKSALFVGLLPRINAQQVALLDVPAIVAQLCALERSVAKATGKELVFHPRNSHDDLANAVAGALLLALARDPLAALTPEATRAFAEVNRALWKREGTDPRDHNSGWIV